MEKLGFRACLPAPGGRWNLVKVDVDSAGTTLRRQDRLLEETSAHGWIELEGGLSETETFQVRVPLLRWEGSEVQVDDDKQGLTFRVSARLLLGPVDFGSPSSSVNQAARRLSGHLRWDGDRWLCEDWRVGTSSTHGEVFKVHGHGHFALADLADSTAELVLSYPPGGAREILSSHVLPHQPQAVHPAGTARWAKFPNPPDDGARETVLLIFERLLRTTRTTSILPPGGGKRLFVPFTVSTVQILGTQLLKHELEADWRAAVRDHDDPLAAGQPLAQSRHELVIEGLNRTADGGGHRKSLAEVWNPIAQTYLAALRVAKGGQELSLLPIVDAAQPVVAGVFSVRDSSPVESPHPVDDVKSGDVLAAQPAAAITVERTGRVIASASVAPVGLHFPRWLDHRGQATGVQAELVPILSPSKARLLAFQLASLEAPVGGSAVRLGALDLDLGGELAPGEPVGLVVGAFRPPPAGDGAVEIFADLVLPVSRARPGGQDEAPREEPGSLVGSQSPLVGDPREHERPLVIPRSLQPEESGLALAITERSDRSRRELTLKLRRAAGAESDSANRRERYLVLDRTPFMVAELELEALGSGERARELGELANWSSDGENGSGWEVLTNDFTLRLPPQGMGEQYERRVGEGIEIDERSEVRFSPPAALELAASPFEQNFAEAPWNLRRLLERPGQRLPGAPIRHLSFELLYGLSTEVEPDRLMLTELFSRLGTPAEEVEHFLAWAATEGQKETFGRFRDGWERRLAVLASRLAVLEPWSVGEPDAQLRLIEGVRGQLRREADLHYPIPGATPPEGSLAPAREDGLKGSVAWGFESRNVYEATWREPRSVAAELERPYFSALGGWGYQKTVFDEGRQAIYSDVAMGRTFYYALERIGRIGVVWNRAKHVIIYERTVAPSLQFTGGQQWHLGRPIVRKVREFVELLEPRRVFAKEGGDPLSTGTLLAAFFPSTRIPVDSAWGADVGAIGWQVPLWRKGEDPRAYPKPAICLTFATSPESGTTTVEAELDEPERLVFYTDTRAGAGSDSDLWEAVPGLDFVDLPIPRPADEEVVDGKSRRATPVVGDSQQPGTPELEPGYERFTWKLVPPERGIDIAGGRADESIEAQLANVTLQRADAKAAPKVEEGSLAEAIQKVRVRLLARVDQLQREVMQAALRGDVKGVEELVKKGQQDLTASADSLRDEIGQLICKPLQDKARDEIKAAFDRAKKYLNEKLFLPIQGVENQIRGSLKEAETALAALADKARKVRNELEQSNCAGNPKTLLDKLKHDAEETLDAYDAIELEALTRLHGDLRDELLSLRNRLLGPLGVAQGLLEQGSRALGPAVRELATRAEAGQEMVTQAETELQVVRERLRDLASTLRQWSQKTEIFSTSASEILARAADAAGALADAADGPGPPELIAAARQAIAAIEAKFTHVEEVWVEAFADAQEQVEGIRALIEELFQETEKRLGQSSEQLASLLIAARQEALKELLTALAEVIASLPDPVPPPVCERAQQVCGDLGAESQRLADLVDGLASALTQARKDLEKQVLAKLTELDGEWEDQSEQLLQALCNAAEEALVQLADELRRALDRLVQDLGAGLQELVGALENLGGAVARLADGLLQRAAEIARQLGQASFQLGSPNLRFLRGWGAPPKVPGLGFSLPNIGYFFHGLDGIALPHVDLSSVTALLDRVGEGLRGLGVRLPTVSLGDRLLPEGLEGFDLSRILPDFGGMRLDGLFPGVSLPKIANDRVKITHGIDKETRRAWVQAELDVPYTKPIDILPFDPLNVRLQSARLQAVTRAEGGIDGQLSSRTRAELLSTWEVSFAGTMVVRLKDTRLVHENGKTSFHINPANVELAEALKFLSDLLAKAGLADTGLTVRLLPTTPPGLESRLLLPLPDVTLGAFSIYNLELLASLTLGFDAGNFFLDTRFGLGKRDRPFALAVSVLAGGGSIELGAKYVPATGALTAYTRMQLAAGAALAFSFGPVRGGVWFFLGVAVEWQSRGGGGLSIELFVLLRGEAQVFGFISVSLALALRARYGGGDGSLVASGSLEITVKIGRFFKTTVRTHVSYRLAGGSGRRAAMSERRSLSGTRPLRATAEAASARPDIGQAADRYIEMLGG